MRWITIYVLEVYEILITIDQAHISRVTDKTLNTVMLPPDWFYQEI